MKIAIEGCAHGELDKIYECLQLIEKREGYKVDLLICCGDFQAVRNNDDLSCMAVPLKYQQLCSFYKYYSGERQAPVLTLFIGGNHEASNYLQELPYGGWVAPNIYYIGRCGVVNFGCLRIVGLSGIYKGNDFFRGLWEIPPYTERSKRSVYHIRSYDTFRLRQLTPAKRDSCEKSQLVLLSHDWPLGIVQYGDKDELLKRKPFFKDDLETGQLGSRPATDLLMLLKPHYWFAAHLHVKFAALVPHEDESNTDHQIFTRFLALDKCLPRRRHLQLLEINDPGSEMEKAVLKHDAEWLAILKLTNHLLSVKDIDNHMPGPGGVERYNFTPTDSERDEAISLMGGDLTIRQDAFVRTAPVHEEGSTRRNLARPTLNPQTANICNRLNIDDPVQLVLARSGKTLNLSATALDVSISDTLDTTGEYSDCSEIFSPQRTAKLSLPPPITPSAKTELEIVEEKKLKLSPELERTQETLRNYASPAKSSEMEPDFCSTPSLAKKPFKRRNQQLYISNCEDAS